MTTRKRSNLVNPKFNLVGKVFSELTVVALHPEPRVHKQGNSRQWICACSCGKEAVVASEHLKSGSTKSCGHLNHLGHNRKSGKFRTKVYSAWKNAFKRCYNDSYLSTAQYKGRGITMSDEFINSFDTFYDYMGDPPTKEHTIERINVNGNYERGNLMWQVKEKQARNKTKLVSNTSGVTGVSFNTEKGATRVSANWRVWSDDKSKYIQKSKYFSVSKYGLLPAFSMACTYREKMIQELNTKGYDYTENHGK